MTSKEALDWLKKQNKKQNNGNGDLWLEMYINAIEKDLEVLDFFKKLFVKTMPLRLTDLQGDKYLSIPNSDIRRPDALLPLSEKEYNLLKEWFTNNLLKEWLKNDRN